jgi:hypothetical protein
LLAVIQLGWPRVSTAQDVTQDLSHGASFTFEIAPNVSLFTFKIIPELRDSDQDGNAQSTVRVIEVFRVNAEKPFQRLEGCDWSEMQPPPQDTSWFRAQDVNFDGYADIFLMTWWGATGNQGGCVWLYNPVAGRFEYSKEFSELSGFTLEPEKKTILTFSNGGMAGLVYDTQKFRVQDNKPILIWHEHQDWNSNTKQFHCVTEELQDGQMVVRKDKRSEPGTTDDWSKVTPPCDSGADI